MTLVKICGVNSEAAFDATVAAGADFIGFNFFPGSPRYVAAAAAAQLSARHAGGPQRVGLFVDPTPAEIAAVLDRMPLDILQIYGAATICRDLRARLRVAVWRAIGIAAAADLPATTENLDGFIIEPKPPETATRPGGNATPLDWQMLTGWNHKGPWLLAGGLTPGNVAAAIATTHAPGVDVSSGVETAPGVKSPDLIRRFVAVAKNTSGMG